MTLTPELVEIYKEILEDPKGHGLKFSPLSECFDASEKVTGANILFQQYVELIKQDVPKVIFYIMMDKRYPNGKDDYGDLGYFLTIKPPTT